MKVWALCVVVVFFLLITVDQVNRVHRLQQKIFLADICCVCGILNSCPHTSVKNTYSFLKTVWSLDKHSPQKLMRPRVPCFCISLMQLKKVRYKPFGKVNKRSVAPRLQRTAYSTSVAKWGMLKRLIAGFDWMLNRANLGGERLGDVLLGAWGMVKLTPGTLPILWLTHSEKTLWQTAALLHSYFRFLSGLRLSCARLVYCDMFPHRSTTLVGIR